MALRLGVVGCGAMAERFHLPSLRHGQTLFPDVQVAWCCDLDAGRAEAAAKLFGAAAVPDFRQAVRQVPVDACVVLVEIASTFEVVGHLLQCGIPTFLEKPPGANLRQAAELARLAGARGTASQVAFNRRHNPYLGAALEHVGGRGALTGLTYEMFRVARREASFPAYTMIHAIDAVRHVAGDPVRWEVLPRDDPRGWSVTARFGCGALGGVAVYPDTGVASERCTVHAVGRSAMACGLHYGTADGLGRAELYEGSQLVRRVDPDPRWARELQEAAGAGFVNQLASFLQSLLAGRRPWPDLAEGLRTMEWVDQILSRLGLRWPG